MRYTLLHLSKNTFYIHLAYRGKEKSEDTKARKRANGERQIKNKYTMYHSPSV